MLIDNLEKHPLPTIPDDNTDPARFGQPTETTKDVFVLELRKFFDRSRQTAEIIEEIPTIRKYDISYNPNETSMETAVNLIQKFPTIDENLPLIAVIGAVGRNIPMGIGGQYVSTVIRPPYIQGANAEPFALANGQTITYKTTTSNGEVHESTIVLRASRFTNIAAATAAEVAYEINFQSLYAGAAVDSGYVQLIYGGAVSADSKGDIEITGGTAITALGFTVGQQETYKDVIPYHRYHQATTIDMAIEVVSEDYNTRTELTDLVWNFFTFQMDERDFMFLGRSTFDYGIPNETYQIILKPDPSMSGEQEVPRPGDEKDKLFVNRINISTTTIQFVDKAVVKNGTTPLYLDVPTVDETIPFKN